MTSNSKAIHCGLAAWAILGGLALLADSLLPADIVVLVSPLDNTPRWVSGITGGFYLLGGALLLVAIFWWHSNIAPALVIGQIAWILIATGATATALISIAYESRMIILFTWALILAGVAIWEWITLLKIERRAHALHHQRKAVL